MPSTTSPVNAVPSFDPAAGNTANTGIDEKDAFVPDVTHYMKEAASIAIMTPVGDPQDPSCVWGAPVCFWGLPATAKSDRIEQAAIEANLPYATIYPGQRQPEDFSGVIVPKEGGGVTIECLIGAVRYLNAIGRGVIFLDEMNEATRATQGALLGFIQKRLVGDEGLKPGIRILAAANPPEWSASGFRLSSPTANRMCHLQVKCPPVKDWVKFMISEESKPKFDSSFSEQVVREKWGQYYSHAKALFIGYMQSRQVTLHQHPHVDSKQSGFCWASPRTWRLAARMKATADIMDADPTLTQLLIEGCVGRGPAEDFFAWAQNANLPRPEDVVANGWKPDNRRLDVAYAVLASVTQYVTSISDRPAAIQAAVGAWKLLNNYIEARMGDITVPASSALVQKKLSMSHDPQLAVVAKPVIKWMTDNNMLKYAEQA